MAEGKTVIEVNGVKLEVDLRHAKRIDELRVGDRVKVLTKEYDGHRVHAGTIVGFEPFASLPTIIIAYVAKDWNKAEIKFVHFNRQSKDIEIVKAIDDDSLDLDREMVLKTLDKDISTKQREIQEIENRKAYFLANFRAYWEPVTPIAQDTEALF